MASINLDPRDFTSKQFYLAGSAAVDAMETEALKNGRSDRGAAACVRIVGRYCWHLNGARASKLAVARHLSEN